MLTLNYYQLPEETGHGPLAEFVYLASVAVMKGFPFDTRFGATLPILLDFHSRKQVRLCLDACLTPSQGHRGLFIHVHIRKGGLGSIFPLISNFYHSVLRCRACVFVGSRIFYNYFSPYLLLRG